MGRRFSKNVAAASPASPGVPRRPWASPGVALAELWRPFLFAAAAHALRHVLDAMERSRMAAGLLAAISRARAIARCMSAARPHAGLEDARAGKDRGPARGRPVPVSMMRRSAACASVAHGAAEQTDVLRRAVRGLARRMSHGSSACPAPSARPGERSDHGFGACADGMRALATRWRRVVVACAGDRTLRGSTTGPGTRARDTGQRHGPETRARDTGPRMGKERPRQRPGLGVSPWGSSGHLEASGGGHRAGVGNALP